MYKILIANQKGGCGKTTVATTLAVAIANHVIKRGHQVFLADTDGQKSSLRWLKIRPKTAMPIVGLDWRDERDIGNLPSNADPHDWLIIDGQGAMSPEKLSQLVAECQLIIVPTLPSFFDVDSTKRFLEQLDEMKRVKKGKVGIHLLANRVRSQLLTDGQPSEKAERFFAKIGEQPIAWVSERSIYQLLSENGLTAFDKTQKPYREMQAQWQAVLDNLAWDFTNLPKKVAKTQNQNWY
ncbi:ParA family protein [Faucicola boevrei]|uniref:ParA family protein n=1 Tax=Faucicola boevrei TaxID=346665 RepID=UPI00037DEF9F|nr:ParA family protein [Moraxella boevrei]